MKKEKNNKIIYIILAISLVIISVLLKNKFNIGKVEDINNYKDIIEENNNTSVNGNLYIHFIDVGQADAIYINNGSNSMLIDAGKNDTANDLVNYLKEQHIDSFDYIIATHPHEDHIGGMDEVLNNFKVDKILMPDKVTTTKTYENLLIGIKNNGCEKIIPKVGEVYNFGNANFTILAPNSNNYEELNNYSIVIKLKYGNNTFLFSGDAETISENEILKNNIDLKCDLLKVGHHGSSTSTSLKFLNAVNPKYAVISVGKDNQYNLPKKTVMNRLKNNNIKVYRTDESGTIIAISDGNNITFNKEPGTYSYMK